MAITDVIRGDDHLSNTPKQLLVLAALGERAPRYAHLPLLHGPDGKKLSKRHGAASVQELREAGYLPDAVRNYLALLGWGAEDDETILSTPELVERFSIDRVGRSSAIFDETKLRWLNGRYMRELDPGGYETQLAAHLERTDPRAARAFADASPERRRAACEIVGDKAQTVAEVWPLISFLFVDPATRDRDEKAWRKVMKPGTDEPLERVVEVLEAADPYEADRLEEGLRSLIESEDVSANRILQPIRVAITGSTISPGIFESLAVLGREESVQRVHRAIGHLRDGLPGDDTDPG